MVTRVTQSLSSSFLSRPVAYCCCATGSLKQKNYGGFRVSATQTNRTQMADLTSSWENALLKSL